MGRKKAFFNYLIMVMTLSARCSLSLCFLHVLFKVICFESKYLMRLTCDLHFEHFYFILHRIGHIINLMWKKFTF